jgi:hypothetical protein
VLAKRRERFAAGIPGDVDRQGADYVLPGVPGTIGLWEGLLLWPAVALHTVSALLLAWTWRAERLQGVGTAR